MYGISPFPACKKTNNNKFKQVRSFCTSWLSDHGAENEYLFAGQSDPLQVETVILSETSLNFKKFFDA